MGIGEALGRGQVFEYLKDLAPNNDVHLHSFEKDTSKSAVQALKEEIDAAGISWTYLPYSNSLGLFSSLRQIIAAFRLLSRIIKKKDVEIIHARSMIPALIGLMLKWRYGPRLLYDIRGFQMDEKAEVGRLKKGGFLYRILKFLETSCYKQADAIVSLTHASRKIIGRYTKVEKIFFIPTCTNRALFPLLSTPEKKKIRNELGYREEDLIFIHTGAVSGWYDFDRELSLMNLLMAKEERLHYLLINRGEHDFIRQKLQEYKIDPARVKIIASKFQDVHRYLNISDAAVFIIKPTFSKIASTPTKFGENLSCHLFSVTNRKIGDMDYYIDQYRVGYIFDIDQLTRDMGTIVEDIRQALLQKRAYQDFDLLFDKYFDKQIGIKAYSQIYRSLQQSQFAESKELNKR